jgi:sarcosine oxidase subunit gamma
VANLIAKSALEGRAPLTIGATTLAEVDVGPITSVAPFPERDVGKALGGFPSANQFITKGDVKIVWSGRAQAFYIGAPCPDLGDLAAVTDQSGGWVTLSLSGPLAVDTLARYVPLDLRLSAFPLVFAASVMRFRVSLMYRALCAGRVAPNPILGRMRVGIAKAFVYGKSGLRCVLRGTRFLDVAAKHVAALACVGTKWRGSLRAPESLCVKSYSVLWWDVSSASRVL